MRLANGTRLGAYEITGVLGAGGMGEVYRARDTKLGREVAIKVLPERLSADRNALALFEREAQAVAALSHPNILAIHEFGESGSTVYAVMELLQGETLRERVKQGSVPVRKAADYAIQIAGALAAAHSKGIVHRDLKPENVFLTSEGRVKLLDFGLASQQPVPGQGRDDASSPTLPHDFDSGTLIGTVGYMSPEQVRGDPTDHRVDVFSFGCVFYEMLTGQRAFKRETAAETMTAILREDPPELSGQRLEIPPGLERVVLHCLEKNPEERFQSARDLAFDLQTALSGSSPSDAVAGRAMRRGAAPRYRLRERVAWGVAAIFLIAGVLITLHYIRQSRPPQQAVFSEFVPPEGTTIGAVAVSPDGRSLAFVGWKNEQGQLWVRSLEGLSARPLAGTDGAAFPFWSPNNQDIGFFADGKLKRIPASGGPVQTLADAPTGRGASWSPDDVILFAPSYGLPLQRMPAGGGQAEPVTQLDSTKGEISHRWPSFLPGGKKFLYFVYSSSSDNTGIYARSLDGKTNEFLVRSGYGAAYAAPGYLVFTRDRALLAQRFDADSLKLTGNPIQVADQIGVNVLEYAHYSVAESGSVLVFRRGGFFQGSQLRWFSRDGQPLGAVGTIDRFWSMRMSPDGQSVAVELQEAQSRGNTIWLYDLTRNASRRFTFDLSDDVGPVWSTDSRSIVFGTRSGAQHFALYIKPASGAGQAQPLLQTKGDVIAQDWSRDGQFISYTELDPKQKAGGSLWVLPMEGERKPIPLIQSASDDAYSRFSPNGRWVAYRSNESGRNEIYVIPFPVAGGKWQVSVGGGDWPCWSADGKELYYLSPDQRMMSISIREKGSTLEYDAPRPLFPVRVLGGLGGRFDPTKDGRRFLVLVQKEENPSPVTLVLNWSASLKR
jgi:Tol biopolymer transport system component/tRNA A-37 threonylcarbamoyl transferase component Bud32